MMTNIRLFPNRNLGDIFLMVQSSVLPSLWQRTRRHESFDPVLWATRNRQNYSMSRAGTEDLDTTEHGVQTNKLDSNKGGGITLEVLQRKR
jgi:hypothetical protein